MRGQSGLTGTEEGRCRPTRHHAHGSRRGAGPGSTRASVPLCSGGESCWSRARPPSPPNPHQPPLQLPCLLSRRTLPGSTLGCFSSFLESSAPWKPPCSPGTVPRPPAILPTCASPSPPPALPFPHFCLQSEGPCLPTLLPSPLSIIAVPITAAHRHTWDGSSFSPTVPPPLGIKGVAGTWGAGEE